MTCSGCSNAVTRVLTRLEGARVLFFGEVRSAAHRFRRVAGVDSFNVNLETKRVVVETSKLSQQAVYDVIAKTGKKTALVSQS